MLSGYNPNESEICVSIYEDCIPGVGTSPPTGQKNSLLTGNSACAGSPCMRQGAIAFLPDSNGVKTSWIKIPMRSLLERADPEARVSLWIRNNSWDALSNENGSWTQDTDGKVVLTAMATLRNTSIVLEQEFAMAPTVGKNLWSMSSPDVGYGGGHNNDNVIADVCVENFLGYNE
jgi:hypothetical protein